MRKISPLRRARRESGFTLIEILVVVAIIALLVSILLPALSRAREQTRNVLCQTHLKELGKAMQMYTMDSKDVLPGPMHPALLKDTRNTNEFQKAFYLPAMLRRYFSERGSGKMTDAIVTCPSFPVTDDKFLSIWGTGPNPFNYCINSWTNTKEFGLNGGDLNYYFGFTHAGLKDYSAWLSTYGDTAERKANYGPKKITRIKVADKEWALADAFQRPRADEVGSAPTKLPRGTWPDDRVSASNSGNPLPRSPFHLGTGWDTGSAAWKYRGRTNTLYFDMHVESQRGFGRYVEYRDDL